MGDSVWLVEDTVVCAGIIVGSGVAEELWAITNGRVACWVLVLLGTGCMMVVTGTVASRDESELNEYDAPVAMLVGMLVDGSTERVVR